MSAVATQPGPSLEQFRRELSSDLAVPSESLTLRPERQPSQAELTFAKDVNKNVDVSLQRDFSRLDDMVRMRIITQDMADRTKTDKLTFEENIELNMKESIYEECGLLLESGAIDDVRLTEIFEVLGDINEDEAAESKGAE